MKKLLLFSLAITLMLVASSCEFEPKESDRSVLNSPSGEFDSSLGGGGFSSADGAGGGGVAGGGSSVGGLITAGEWSDLENWNFFENVLLNEEIKHIPSHWEMNPTRRVELQLVDFSNQPIRDIPVALRFGSATLWETKTDNKGIAQFWIDPYQDDTEKEISSLSIDINYGQEIINDIKSIDLGSNRVQMDINTDPIRNVEISFIVDATGSMGDELEFLKKELYDVIRRVENEHQSVLIQTSSVFYRDEGDDYVTKVSPWASDIGTTVDFISEQSAGGGGDFPEAVHSALSAAIDVLPWSQINSHRLCFLILDAPPHHEVEVIESMKATVEFAAKQGIKIIPITASGIDKETEFLMRFMSVLTNGTYVFITNDSGIGNHHIEPTIGDYDVEYLNDLMVRLIGEYIK